MHVLKSETVDCSQCDIILVDKFYICDEKVVFCDSVLANTMIQPSSFCCSKQHYLITTALIFLFLITTTSSLDPRLNGCFTSMFGFGDSLTDTGNMLEASILQSKELPASAFPPNGRTFFHHPTGRRCDGRLVIDFLAEGLGIPYLQPSLKAKRREDFEQGVNFAIAGANVLNSSFLQERGIYCFSNISLFDEVKAFKDLLPSLCSSSSYCKEFLKKSLIVMGVIGGNDYNHALQVDRKEDTQITRQLVPLVVHTITSSIQELIELGAVTFLVPGNYPIGCSPAYLTNFHDSNKDKYDPLTGCLTWLNQFAQHHNQLLQKELNELRNRYPHVNIVYGDYFNTAMRFYDSPDRFGFKETLNVCCGIGDHYNYNSSTTCGYPPVERSCDDPSSSISWDGIHYTEAANKWVADAVLEDLMNSVDPSLNNLCPTSTLNKARTSM